MLKVIKCKRNKNAITSGSYRMNWNRTLKAVYLLNKSLQISGGKLRSSKESDISKEKTAIKDKSCRFFMELQISPICQP